MEGIVGVVVDEHSNGISQPGHKPNLGSYVYLLALMAAIGGFL